MPYVHRLISQLWAELPSSVHGYEEVTSRSGGPAPTMREAILAQILFPVKVTSVEVKRASFTGPTCTLLSEHDERIFTEVFRKNIPHITLHGEWLHLLSIGRDKPGNSSVPIDKLGLTARKMASDYPAPFSLDVDVRDALIREALSERAGDSVPIAVNAAIRRHRDELQDLLDEVWSVGWETVAIGPPPGADIGKFVAACGFIEGVPVVGPEASDQWARIRSSAYAAQFAEDKPDLDGGTDFEIGAVEGTLGSSIRRRLRAGQRVPMPENSTALSLVQRTIEWSVRPYGLPEQWCWAVMAIGEQIGAVLSPPDSQTASPRAIYALVAKISDEYGGGGWSTILRNWARITIGASQYGSTGANRLVDAPERYYLGRLRGRVLMKALEGDLPPNAEWVWANVYGALKSTFMEAQVRPHLRTEVLEENS